MLGGEIKDYEHYRNLVGQVQALNFVKEEIRDLLKNMETFDD
jgi:hypothetical protein